MTGLGIVVILVALAAVVAAAVAGYLLLKAQNKNKFYERKYAQVISAEAAAEAVNEQKAIVEKNILQLQSEYSSQQSALDALVAKYDRLNDFDSALQNTQSQKAAVERDIAQLQSERNSQLSALDALVAKYNKLNDLDSALQNMQSQKAAVERDIIQLQREHDKKGIELRLNYDDKKKIFDALVRECAIYDETIELAELGFYKPHYEFDDSEDYQLQIYLVRNQQQGMISCKTHITCGQEWTVGNSRREGQKATNRTINLAARAFNNECAAAIANARWNNMERMKERICKSFKSINKLCEVWYISISPEYLMLKLQELRLTHEYKVKKQEEKEEEKENSRRLREEEKFRKEAEGAQKDEDKYDRLLAKAKKDAEKAAGTKLSELENEIAALTEKLAEAHEKNERAKSMAQQTKSGHVYVISNIGSFGENIYKIGMTRRLDPRDRVKELGDASVPFGFDVHAMIFSKDAPDLESKLHKAFEAKRMNLANTRKEFFNVSLEDIKEEVKRASPDAVFYETVEARQYKESEAIRAQRSEKTSLADALSKFPDSL